jgi:hypothetical protein
MPQITAPRRLRSTPVIPSGDAPLRVRKRYLRRRSQRRRLGDRGMAAIWVAVGALVSWVFVVGFTTLGH